MTRRVRHIKRGTEYDVIGTARIQCAEPISDDSHVILYKGDDDQIWARPIPEFEDGRFINVPSPATWPSEANADDATIETLTKRAAALEAAIHAARDIIADDRDFLIESISVSGVLVIETLEADEGEALAEYDAVLAQIDAALAQSAQS